MSCKTMLDLLGGSQATDNVVMAKPTVFRNNYNDIQWVPPLHGFHSTADPTTAIFGLCPRGWGIFLC